MRSISTSLTISIILLLRNVQSNNVCQHNILGLIWHGLDIIKNSKYNIIFVHAYDLAENSHCTSSGLHLSLQAPVKHFLLK
jgi:hypothetical protein